MAIGLLVLGCSGGSDGDGKPVTSTEASADAESDAGATVADSEVTTGDASSDEDAPVEQTPIEVVQLGFTVDRFEVPRPGPRSDVVVLLDEGDDEGEPTGDESAVDAAELAAFDALPYDDGQDLLDTGIEAGTWTEVEGLRAILSVLLGELPADAIDGFDELRRASHGRLIDRVVEVLDDPAVDAAERADLARLASFFLDDEFPGVPAEDWDPARPTGLRRIEQQRGSGCQQVEESIHFKAPDTRLCYVRYTNDAGDIVYVPTDEAISVDPDAVFEVLEIARTGYRELAETELPPVWVLLSTNELPVKPDQPDRLTWGHALGGGPRGGVCRIALFAARETHATLRMNMLIAHELFHCIQDRWPGSGLDEMTTEGGAEYFSYKLLGDCDPVRWGPQLDRDTARGSLLQQSYPGWFFWAFLEDGGQMSVQEIAQLHRDIAGGVPIDRAVNSAVPDLPATLNEFYVRLIGPGVACGYKGSFFTDTITVSETGPIEVREALWYGLRYRLEYSKGIHFEQRDGGAGPIGMAPDDDSRSESGWVKFATDVRPTCKDDDTWIVVPGSATDDSIEEREIEVFTADDANCDPCMLGTWQLDLDSIENLFRTLGGGQLPPGTDLEISGSWAIAFSAAADGTTTFEDRRNVLIAASFNDASVGITIDGNGIGSFTSTGDSVDLIDIVDTAEATLEGFSGFSSSTDSAAFTYICDGNALSFQVEGQTLQADRVPPIPEGDPYF